MTKRKNVFLMTDLGLIVRLFLPYKLKAVTTGSFPNIVGNVLFLPYKLKAVTTTSGYSISFG